MSPTPTDPFAALKSAGGDLLRTLGCATKCSLRKRTSFGWVLEVCGLCAQQTYLDGIRCPRDDNPKQTDIMDAFHFRLLAEDWDGCPVWALRYLADGPKPVPFASLQMQGQDGAPSPAAPSWAVRLLHLGTPMKSWVSREKPGPSVAWPKVFEVAARDEEKRKALDAVIRLHTPEVGGKFSFNDETAALAYDFLKTLGMDVFVPEKQANTRPTENRPVSKTDFGPPIKGRFSGRS